MTHAKLFLTKFLFSFAVLLIILGWGFDVSFGNVFLISLVLTAVSYLVGDIFLLSKTSNTSATLGDFVLIFAIVYLISDALTVGDDVFQATLYATISLTIFEYFFHQSVARSLENEEKGKEKQSNLDRIPQYRVETSEEISPDENDGK
ncbi:UNVERIFIED_CONTAM: YndM family protein [Halobacillus marinus]|uniref:YndM family protein n=1 Tax=Halobacillus sp. BAB-2008 TaxID=1246484 RepID=UPI0002A50429|nr:YndM family protein [Halobacillus sp. BAB-2008]ELK44192.1 hypothetical protein D479_20128 [Halobacillus sp. BAB-2008]